MREKKNKHHLFGGGGGGGEGGERERENCKIILTKKESEIISNKTGSYAMVHYTHLTKIKAHDTHLQAYIQN